MKKTKINPKYDFEIILILSVILLLPFIASLLLAFIFSIITGLKGLEFWFATLVMYFMILVFISLRKEGV